ncbi:hypothetical protein Q765_18470 [Flavobacterium rivuli WB 3.3-2 = DSM 21788]|uniref:Membrane receptor RagA n=1 Tax=Flavobacterium rivuli WB 3.3-2 = DSM 21788 TaxID=1121895 RepID=A0A0A2M9N3_9FLAO|nr:DUF5686 and carboxypeptidase regulatory-like domain-containing protein [Flavobacterium rivuli]KGO85000.1 hypothetical protein Q765_18470 [Flavobacterium rivuli WB 3.3-2 = DSM 21788]
MKHAAVIILFLFALPAFAQLKGKVTAKNGEPVAFASITVEGTYTGTSANQNGQYSFAVAKGKQTLIVRSIGYKTKEVAVTVSGASQNQNITLDPENYQLKELVIDQGNPANTIIANAIQNRTANAEKTALYEADFYSRGVVTLKDLPKKILGQEIGDLGASVDSSGNGILYLSETVSKIKYERPGKINERVIASKVSGEAGEFSYNNADAADFDFYANYLPFEVSVISPIAYNAFDYYTYALESTFTDAGGQTINKIKVMPKRENQASLDGYIYIVEGTGEISAAELGIAGSAIKQPLLDRINIRQTFGYNAKEELWSKNVQVIDFHIGLLGVESDGTFSYVYSNYNFKPGFNKNWFSPEIQYFEPESNKKAAAYWNTIRPIPLTAQERNDYFRKEKLEELRSTKAYQDSTDRQRNRFKWTSIPVGYTYHNTAENWEASYTGIIRRLSFNTVQAYAFAPGFYYTKFHPNNTYTTIGTDLNYGFAEKRFRATGTISHKFNNFSKRIVTLTGGSSIEQFNPENPINKIVNSISSLFFKDNYMKLFDNNFVRIKYEEEVLNGIKLFGSFEYTRKKSLFNNTNFSTLKDLYDPYLSNNPLLPEDHDAPAFLKHNMLKTSVATRINFGQTYRTRPDGRETISNDKYPSLYLKYEKGFAASINDYNFDHLSTRVTYDLAMGDVGELGVNLRAGKFFNSKNIAFTDYRHFNGNQTYVGKSERYLNVFNLLPYYTHSTNDQYFEAHLEHNFKGYLTNSIPVLEKLNYYLVAGYHFLAIPEQKPYMETTIGLDNVGWGKFRLLRIDYIHSINGNSRSKNGVILGLTFIDFLE